MKEDDGDPLVQYARDPLSVLGYFKEALQENPRIQDLLQKRRFAFVQVLEDAEKTTDPKVFNKTFSQIVMITPLWIRSLTQPNSSSRTHAHT